MALTALRAVEAAAHGVRVNAVAPAWRAPLPSTGLPDDELERLRQAELFGRSAETWEVANVMVFLASDYSSYMSGEIRVGLEPTPLSRPPGVASGPPVR